MAAGLGVFGLLFPVGAEALSSPEAPAKVYFSNGGRIVSVNADGSDRTVLTRQGKVTSPEALGHVSPEVSPDRSRMVFAFRNNSGVVGHRLIMSSVDGTAAEVVLADRPNLAQGRTPTWTPDGERLVVAREVQKGKVSTPSVVSIHPDGSGMTTLFSLPGQVDRFPYDERLVVNRAEMSPDGGRLLVEVDNVYKDNDTRLEVVDLTSGERRSLGEQTRSGSWSADGSSIIYVSSRGSRGEYCEVPGTDCLKSGDIFVAGADGSDRQRVTTTAANEDSPSWSPDGDRILYTSNRVMPRFEAATEVYSMKADGTCRVALTNGAPGSFSPVWGGSGSGAQPVCGQAPPPVLVEVNPKPVDSLRPVYWAGRNAGGLLLSSAGVFFNLFYYLTYEDCDLAVPAACNGALGLTSGPVCQFDGRDVLSDVFGRKDASFSLRRGAAVVTWPDPQGRVVGVLAGGSLSWVTSWGDRAAASSLELVDRLQLLPGTKAPVGRLPAARVPVRDLRMLRKVERTVDRLGSVRAAAAKFNSKQRWVREYLRFGKRIRLLGPIRTVRCPARGQSDSSRGGDVSNSVSPGLFSLSGG